MKEEILRILGSLLNPFTQKTLSEERRITSVDVKTESVKIRYDREGIPSEHKKNLEEQMVSSLQKFYTSDQISIYSTSDAPPTHKAPEAKKKLPAKKIIAVASGKGGVGKSTVALNLAISLKNLGLKVGLLDADIYGPSAPLLLGKRHDHAIGAGDGRILPLKSHGISFMSFGLFIKESDPVIWRSPMLANVLRQFLYDVDWDFEGELDLLILDLPPGTGDVQLSLSQLTQITGVVIVSTPQELALIDVIKGVQMFRQVKVPILGVVENMSFFICSKCSEEHFIFGESRALELAKKLETNLLGRIPLDSSLRKSCDEGLPFMEEFQKGETAVSKAYLEISKKVVKLLREI